MSKKPTRDELADEVRRLQEQLKDLGGGQAPHASPDGLAEGIVTALGRMVPGLSKLIQAAEAVPEFHDRLSAIDEEVKRRFREQPLRRVSADLSAGSGTRRMGIPPSVRGRSGVAAGAASRGSQGRSARRKARQPQSDRPRIHISPDTPEELCVDVFDEGDHLLVLAEAPNLTLDQVHVSAEESELHIDVNAPDRTCRQRIDLPCPARGKPKVSLANGILRVRLNKAEQS